MFPYGDLLIVLLLTALNGVFSMSELAVVSSREARLRPLAEAGHRGAAAALRLKDDPSAFLSTVQIGITLIGIVAGAYGGAALGDSLAALLRGLPVVGEHAEAVGIAAAIAVITYLSLVVGELVPKRVAMRDPERIAVLVARPMALVAAATAPVVWLLKGSTDGLLRALGLHGGSGETVTEEEVKSMIDEGTSAGVLEPREREMIEGVMRLADRSVRAVMTPRPDVVWLDAADPVEAWADEIAGAKHSCYPVCRGEIDEIVGVVRTKTLLTEALAGRLRSLESVCESPLVIHDTQPMLRVLDMMRDTGQHFAVVVDEYGGFEGVVSLTDIMETIAGDMPEGHEDDSPAAVRRADGSWRLDGSAEADEIGRLLGVSSVASPEGAWHTLAGFVLDALGRVPGVGDVFERDGVRFEVVDMDGRRIDKLLVTRLDTGAADEVRSAA